MIEIVDKKGNVQRVHPVDAMEIVRSGNGKYLRRGDVPKPIQLMGEKATVSALAPAAAKAPPPEAGKPEGVTETPEKKKEAVPEGVVAELDLGASEPVAAPSNPTGKKLNKRGMNGND